MLLNAINHQTDTDKFFLYAKVHLKQKSIPHKKREQVGLKHFNYPNAFNEYSNNTNKVYVEK